MSKFCLLLAALAAIALPAAAEVVTPAAIYMPAGGKVVTEVNLGDADVLGMVKQSIPAVGDVLRELAPSIGKEMRIDSHVDVASLINLDEFAQAIAGVKDVRLLLVRYPKTMTPQRFVAEFTRGVAKTGAFNKTITDFGFFPGSVRLFSAPDNGGIIAFAYNPDEHLAYALRVVGGEDVPKLIRWGGRIVKVFVENQKDVHMVQESGHQAGPSNPPAEVK